MFQFVFCGLLATFFAYLSQFKGKKFFLILSMVVITYIMGLQDAAAIDFKAYARNFEDIMAGFKDYGFLNLKERHSGGVIEVGWYTLNKVLGSIIHSYHFVSLVAAIFMSVTIYKMLKKVDSKWYWLSLLYFYFINMQFCMSGVRQALAMMCFMLATLYIIEQKWRNLILIALLGLSFHNSFIIILFSLPLLFIPDSFIENNIRKIISACVIIYVLILVQANSIRMLLIQEFMTNLEENASDYDQYLESILQAKMTFLNTLFRLINFVFIIIAFYYGKAKERKLMLFFLISTYAIAIVGENSPLARVNDYFTIFATVAMCIIPSVIKNAYLRNAFVALTLIYIIKIAIDNTTNYIYKGYLDFHTIIF